MNEQVPELIQSLTLFRNDLRDVLSFQMGTSSSFSKYINSITSNIIDVLQCITQKYSKLYEDKVSISFLNENERQKTELFQIGFSDLNSYLKEFRQDYLQLEQSTVALSYLLIQSEQDNIELREKLNQFIQVGKKMKERIEQLQNELFTKNQLIKWIKENNEQLFTNPTFFLEAKASFDAYKNSFNDEKAIQIQLFQDKIEELQSQIAEITNSTNQTIDDQKEEIAKIKLEKDSLTEVISKQNQEKSQFQVEIGDLKDRILFYKQEMANKKVIQKAINEFCSNYPFISFDGSSFQYQVDSDAQPLILEKALSMTRNENDDYKNQIIQLKKEIETQKKKFEKEKEDLIRSNKYKIDRLNLELDQIKSENIQNIERRNNAKKTTLLSYQVQDENNRIEELTKENQSLQAKVNELLKRQDQLYQEISENKLRTDQNIELQEMPDISSLFKPLAPPSDADIILREANENLQKKKTELMQENQKKDETIEKMKKDIDELKLTNQNLLTDLDDAKNQIKAQTDKINEWKKFTDGIINGLNSTDSVNSLQYEEENNQLKTKISELEAQIKDTQEKLQEEAKKGLSLKIHNDQQVSQLNKQINDQKSEITELKDQINQLESSQSTKNTNDESLLAQKDEEIDHLNQQIQLLEKLIEGQNSQDQQEKEPNSNSQPPEPPENPLETDINYIEEPHPIAPPEIDEPSVGESRDVEENENEGELDAEIEQQDEPHNEEVEHEEIPENNVEENVVKEQEEHTNTDENHEQETKSQPPPPPPKPANEQYSHSRSQYDRNRKPYQSRYNTSQNDKNYYQNRKSYQKRQIPRKK